MSEHDMPRDGDAKRLAGIALGHHESPDRGCDYCFLMNQISSRDAALRECDAEIERLCLAIGGLRMRIEDQGKEIEWLRIRNATLEAAAEAAIEWREARRSVLVSCAKSEMLTSAQVVRLNNMEKGIERALAALYAAPKSTAAADCAPETES